MMALHGVRPVAVGDYTSVTQLRPTVDNNTILLPYIDMMMHMPWLFSLFQYPLSPFQAFAIALSAVDGKLADSKRFQELKKLASDKGDASKVCIIRLLSAVTTAGYLRFHPYGSVCCACAQRPGLPRARPSRARRGHTNIIFFDGSKN